MEEIGLTTSRQDTTLEALKLEIFRKHGINEQKLSAAFYDETGLPFTRTVSVLTITDCSLIGGFGEEAKLAEPLPRVVYVVLVPSHIDSVCHPKLAHDLD